MAQWILRVDGSVISRQTARPLKNEEVNSHLEKAHRSAFDLAIQRKLGASNRLPESNIAEYDNYEDDIGGLPPEIPDTDDDGYDQLVNSEVVLPHQDKQMNDVVVGRHLSDKEKTFGTRNDNPILNIALYDVRFPDGAIKQYAANIIAENVYTQADHEGHRYLMLYVIVDHKKLPEAVSIKDQYFTTKMVEENFVKRRKDGICMSHGSQGRSDG